MPDRPVDLNELRWYVGQVRRSRSWVGINPASVEAVLDAYRITREALDAAEEAEDAPELWSTLDAARDAADALVTPEGGHR